MCFVCCFGYKLLLDIHTFESGVDRFKGRDCGKKGGKQSQQNSTCGNKYISCLLMRTTIVNERKKSTELKPSPWVECQAFSHKLTL